MPNGSGKTIGEIVKSLGLVLAILYIVIAQIVVPAFKANSSGSSFDLVSIAQSNIQRIARLEAVVARLEDVPTAVASQTEAIGTLKSAVDKLGEKIDRHIAKDSR